LYAVVSPPTRGAYNTKCSLGIH